MRRLAESGASPSIHSLNERPNRSSFIHATLLSSLSSIGLFVGSAELVSMEKAIEKNESSYGLTIDELSNVISNKLHGTLCHAYPTDAFVGPIKQSESQTKTNEPCSTQETSRTNQESRLPTIGEIQNGLSAVVTYITHYRLSSEKMKKVDPKNIDCNDYANRACEELSKHDLPMYLISIRPKNLTHIPPFSWHEFAACKLDDQSFLIVDNVRTVVWHGTLKEYIAEQTAVETDMELLECLGVSEYRETRLDISLAKVISQVKHAFLSEADMTPYHLHSKQGAMIASQMPRRQYP